LITSLKKKKKKKEKRRGKKKRIFFNIFIYAPEKIKNKN
jgi:hypothetical protein